MRYLKIASIVISCLFLVGCIQTDTVIKVRPDGSGVIEETVKLSNELLESLKSFSKGMSEAAGGEESKDKKKPGAPAEDPIQGMIKDAKSKDKQYGPGVKFVSANAIKGETMSGYRALYAFKDINTLRINQNPENKTMPAAEGQPTKKEEIIRFSLVRGPAAVLTIRMPENKPEGEKPAAPQQKPPENDPNAAEMMKVMFKDMSIRVAVEVVGKIVRTNATYQDNARITLVDMHFGKIFENEKVFQTLNAAQPKTVEEMKALVKDIKGLKVEMNNPVEVIFQ